MNRCRRQLVQVALLWGALSGGAAHAGELRGWPVRLDGNISTSNPAVGDVDGDGRLEIVIGAGLSLHVVSYSGAPIKPFPLAMTPPRKDREKDALGGAKSDYPASPTLCELNGAPGLEIAILSLEGQLHVYDGTGKQLPGFPVEGGGVWASAPACADLDGDKAEDLVWAGLDGVIRAVNAKGVALRGFPLKGFRMAEGLLALGEFHANKGMELAFGGVDGALHVVGQDKKGAWVDLPGFPVRTEFTVTGGPALADLNADGRLELSFGSQDFNIFAVQDDGTLLPNFPVKTAYRIYVQPSVGDLDRDGRLDLIVGGGDGNVYALNHLGQSLRGWPVMGKGRISASAAVGDLDQDGGQEVVFCGGDGKVNVVRGNGTPVGGFPTVPGGVLSSAPLIVDLDQDGRMEVVVATSLGWLHAYSFQALGHVQQATVVWPTVGHDSGRVSRTRPNPALFKAVSVSPAGARTLDDLKVTYTFVDLDGDPETDTQIRWYRNDARVPELDNKPTVPNPLTKKGERWRFTVQEGADFKIMGEGKGATVFQSAPLPVRNTPPTPPVVSINPPAPSTLEALEVKIETPSTDADGDVVAYAYRWFKNREPLLDLPLTANRVDPSRTKKGEVWRVVVIPTDGTEDGAVAVAEATIRNTPPSAARIALTPNAAGAAVPLKAVIEQPAVDPDEEVVTYQYGWKLMEEPIPFLVGRDGFPALAARRGQTIELTVTPRDSEADGPSTKASVTLGNTPPSQPLPAIHPATARTDDDLWAGIATPSLDHDMDDVAYTFQWTLDGAAVALPAGETTVGKDRTTKGQKYILTAIPLDGTVQGGAGKVELTIADTAPGLAKVELEPWLPRAGEAVKVTIKSDAPDADGDAVTYRVVWLKDGKDATARAKDRDLPAGTIKKNETWQALVTANDGQLSGTPATAVELRVQDTPPTAPVVALAPVPLKTDDVLKATIKTPATDVDGDKISYRYRWFVDGMLQDLPETQDQVPADRTTRGQVWKVVAVPVADGAEGTPAAAETTVVNTPPRPATPAIVPNNPSTSVPLLASLVSPASDADGDRVAVRFRWVRQGAQLVVEGPVLPADKTARGETWALWAIPNDGLEDGPEAKATVTIGNTPPVPPAIGVSAVRLKATDTLELKVTRPAHDDDGDPVTLEYAWTANGKEVPAWRNKTRLTPAELKKDSALRVTVTPSDQASKGQSVSADVLVENTQPTAPKIRFQKDAVSLPETLKVELVTPAVDVDKDVLQYRYRFFRNGVRVKLPEADAAVPVKLIQKSDRWTVDVVAFDGQQEGPAVTAEATVINAAPSAPKIGFARSPVMVTDAVAVTIQQPAVDPDGDAVGYRYTWTRNGKAESIPQGVSRLPRRLLKKGDTWRVEVIATDGWLKSAPVAAEIKVINSLPTAPQVAFVTVDPLAGDRLDVAVTAPATDVDGDPISYRYRFKRNGAPVKLDESNPSVPGKQTGGNETWKVEVVAFDGEKESPAATAELKVAAPPPPPKEPKPVPGSKEPPKPVTPPAPPPPRPEPPPPPPPPPSPKPTVDAAEPFQDEPALSVPPPLPVARCRLVAPGGKELGPGDVRAGQALEATVAWDGPAPKGISTVWLRNGADASSQAKGNALNAGVVKKGETWQAAIRQGNVTLGACVERVVGDTPPPAALALALDPVAPKAGQGLQVKVGKAAVDVDGDAVTYRYRWWRNGAPAALAPTEDRVPPALIRKGDVWKVEVMSVAAGAEGGLASAETTVGNTPPTPPEVVVVPAEPRVGQALVASIKRPAADVDGDPVTLAYAWTVNGKPAPDLKGPDVPPSRVKKGETWSVAVTPSDGIAPGEKATAAVTAVNTQPEPPVVTLGEPIIRAGATISFQQLKPATDVDGDPVKITRRWLLNGGEVPAWADKDKLSWPELKKNQRVRVEVTPNDGAATGRTAFAEVQTRNTPPTAPQVAFEKTAVPVTEPLKATIKAPATDVDGDALVYRHRYFRNGVRVATIPETSVEVPLSQLRKGDRWRVTVVAFDGETEGPPSSADALVLNTMPGAPVALEVLPAQPRTTDALTCKVRTPAPDADQDALTYVTRWIRNGKPTSVSPTAGLALEATHKGEQWSCTAAAFDGEVLGPFATAAPVTILNSVPPPPAVAITPTAPRVGDPLRCRVSQESLDADGDPVRYAFRWDRNGKAQAALDGAWEVSGDQVKRGDTWECWALASDGAVDSGPKAPRSKVVVGNTAPKVPVVEIRPEVPVAGQPLRCEVTNTAADPDGDRVSYRVEWRKNGQVQPFAPTELQVAGRHVLAGQEWRCVLTATDGKLDSEAARSPPVTIQPPPGGAGESP